MDYYNNNRFAASPFNLASGLSSTSLPTSTLENYSPLSNGWGQDTRHFSPSYSSTLNFSEDDSTGGSSSLSPDNSSVRPNNVSSWVYQGFATVVYGIINPLTNTISNIFSRTVQAVASIGNRSAAAGIVESNPFNLTIRSATQNQDGDFGFFSAIPFNGFLAQYWQFQYNNNTGQISGQLTNPQTSTALATNALVVTETFPGLPYTGFSSYAAMQAGSTISGTITSSQIQVQIEGLASGLVSSSYVFEITTNLSRVS